MKKYRPILIVVVVIVLITAIFAFAYYEGKRNSLIVGDDDFGVSGGGQIEAETALIKIFAANHKQTIEQTHVNLTNMNTGFVSGSISFGATPGEGGVFLARMTDKNWAIDYEGNGSIDCVKIRTLGYPENVLTGFCDPLVACTAEAKLCPDGSAVGRSGPNCEFSPCPGATGANLSASCQDQKGTWLAQYNECEYISKAWCDQVGGTFNECASACRHDAKAEVCTLQCVTVCSLK